MEGMMKRWIALFAIVLSCASCKTGEQVRQEQDQSDRDYCRSIGAIGDKYTDCMLQKNAQRARHAELEAVANQQNLNRQMDLYRQSRNTRPTMTNVSCPPNDGSGVTRSCLVY
jgi:hypothetical protein